MTWYLALWQGTGLSEERRKFQWIIGPSCRDLRWFSRCIYSKLSANISQISLLTDVSQAARKWEREKRDLCRTPARILSSMRRRLMATNDILATCLFGGSGQSCLFLSSHNLLLRQSMWISDSFDIATKVEAMQPQLATWLSRARNRWLSHVCVCLSSWQQKWNRRGFMQCWLNASTNCMLSQRCAWRAFLQT